MTGEGTILNRAEGLYLAGRGPANGTICKEAATGAILPYSSDVGKVPGAGGTPEVVRTGTRIGTPGRWRRVRA